MPKTSPATTATRRDTTPPNRLAAGLLGATEGLAEGLRESRLAQHSEAAIHQGALVVKGVARGAGKGRIAIERPVRRARQAVRHAIDRTEQGAEAVAETGRRAVQAPPRILNDLKEAGTSYGKGWAKGAAFYAVAGVVAIVAFACLTAGFVIGLDILLGAPWGAFVVTLAYAAFAFTFFLMARKAIRRGTDEASRHVEAAKRRGRAIAQPLRDFQSRPARPARRTTR
ncbi:MAG TPA: phage holin family protein [Candidatus Thermoplasmatota archaeon]|nr:phage holin family protein [Candidatus Thermoplasmatota archaeon]